MSRHLAPCNLLGWGIKRRRRSSLTRARRAAIERVIACYYNSYGDADSVHSSQTGSEKPGIKSEFAVNVLPVRAEEMRIAKILCQEVLPGTRKRRAALVRVGRITIYSVAFSQPIGTSHESPIQRSADLRELQDRPPQRSRLRHLHQSPPQAAAGVVGHIWPKSCIWCGLRSAFTCRVC